jgi:uncharacterized protein (TIGR02246 family)
MTPEDFPRAFAAAFSAQDAAAIGLLLDPSCDLVTPTGQHAEGRAEAEAALAAEFAGVFRAARLVKGRLRLRPLGDQAAVLAQRYVVTGAQDAGGADLPRCTLLLSAVIAHRPEGWQALSATLTVLADPG